MAYNVTNSDFEQFKGAMKRLAENNQSVLRRLVSQEECSGKLTYIDRDGTGTRNAEDASGTPGYANFGAGSVAGGGADDADFAAYKARMTPHKNPDYIRTLVQPTDIEWGHWFNTEQEIKTLLKQSRVTRNGNIVLQKGVDDLIIEAAFAPTVSRMNDMNASSPSASDITFPAANKLQLDEAPTLEAMLEIASLFEEKSDNDQQIICVLSPKLKQILLRDSDVTSKDFAAMYAPLNNFTIPQLAGITFVTHSRLNQNKYGNKAKLLYGSEDAEEWFSSGYSERMLFFQPDGIAWGQWEEMDYNMGKASHLKFENIAYCREWGNAVRVDDERVIQVEVATTALTSKFGTA